MQHDKIVDGEAMLDVEGVDVTHLVGSSVVIDMQRDPQRAAFLRYRLAFRQNEARPNLPNAVALAGAYNNLREAMGLVD